MRKLKTVFFQERRYRYKKITQQINLTMYERNNFKNFIKDNLLRPSGVYHI